MKSSHTERIIERLSLKYNLPKRVIKVIVLSQFEYVRNSMRSATKGEFETFISIRLKSFGLWKVHQKKMERIHAARKRKEKKYAEAQELKKQQEDGLISDKE